MSQLVFLLLLGLTTVSTIASGLYIYFASNPTWAPLKASILGFVSVLFLGIVILESSSRVADEMSVHWLYGTPVLMGVAYFLLR